VSVSVRRIKIAMASGCPAAAVWGAAAVRLNAGKRARLASLTRAAAAQAASFSRPTEISSSLPPQPGKVPAPRASPGATKSRAHLQSENIAHRIDRPLEDSVRYPG
jgi:hypothetical protein